MRCGATCFIVEIETESGIETKRVNARTPADARKITRASYDEDVQIHSVIKKRRA